jgi:hypothetical protein
VLAPSASAQWINCPGSLAMQAGEEDRGSIYAEEGTAMHEFAAAALTTGTPAEGFRGRIFTSEEGNDFEVDDEAIEAIQLYLDRIADYRARPGREPHLLMVEQRIYFGREIEVDDNLAFGTSDGLIIDEDDEELQVHDLKYGKGVRVSAEWNTQGMLYALGAIRLVSPFFRPKRVRIVIHQPRLGNLDEWVIDTFALEQWGRTIARDAARKALAELYGMEYPTLVAGDKQCRFCSARGACPEAAKRAMNAAVDGFDNTTDAATLKLREIPDDLEALGRYALMVPFIEDWCRAVAGRLDKVMIEQGRKVPGFKVVLGKAGNRYWKDAAGAENALCNDFPQAKTHTLPKLPELKSPAQIEKVVGKAVMHERLSEFVGQAPPGKTVVPVSDKRPEVEDNTTEGFDGVEDGGDLT